MQIRRITIERFRGIDLLQLHPGPRTVILGPNNAGKSTILEALDLLLHPGLGRPRPTPDEVDYFQRDPSKGFEIEAVIGHLSKDFRAQVHLHLEGWRQAGTEMVPEPDGEGVEPVIRVRVRGTPELEMVHEFAKPESEGSSFHRALREPLAWVFDGRTRDARRQLSFYQGGLLDRLFANADLDPAILALREALGDGADAVNTDEEVESVLTALSGDLVDLGLLVEGDTAEFEAGAVSRRALLQTLRLALPGADEVLIPLARHGRGAQRLVLVAVLLRIARAAGIAPIGAFEEPEEALEPLRQAQLADMMREIADQGGQLFVVTHSPDMARCFGIEDFLLLHEQTSGEEALHLRGLLSAPVRQAYERRLDGPVVRGLFCRHPLLVEGPGDRAVFETFWRELTAVGEVLPFFRAGLDVINAEGVTNMPMLATVLDEAGKAVGAWVDLDSDQALREVERLKREAHCAALMLHDPTDGRQNLEQALAWGCSLEAVAKGMQAIAVERGYSWDDQRNDLLSRCDGVDREVLERAKAAESVSDFLAQFEEGQARGLIASALGAKGVTPFEIKGARQARVVAETIVKEEGVPENFARALREFNAWIGTGSAPGAEIQMVTGG